MNQHDMNKLADDVIAFLITWGMWDDGCTVYCGGKKYAGSRDKITATDYTVPRGHLSQWCYDDFNGKTYLYDPRIDPEKHLFSMSIGERMYCMFNAYDLAVPWEELGDQARDYFRENEPELFVIDDDPLFHDVTFDPGLMTRLYCGFNALFTRRGLWLQWLTDSAVCALTTEQRFSDIQLSDNDRKEG